MSRGGGGGRKKPLTYKEKSGIHFVKQDEPDFIKKMKAQLGYREHKLEDKFEGETSSKDEQGGESDDEFGENGPQVVVLDPKKDISREELDKELELKKKEKDDQLIAEGKIIFRKPGTKREGSAEKETNETKKPKSDKDDNASKVNKSLLSFGDDDEDE